MTLLRELCRRSQGSEHALIVGDTNLEPEDDAMSVISLIKIDCLFGKVNLTTKVLFFCFKKFVEQWQWQWVCECIGRLWRCLACRRSTSRRQWRRMYVRSSFECNCSRNKHSSITSNAKQQQCRSKKYNSLIHEKITVFLIFWFWFSFHYRFSVDLIAYCYCEVAVAALTSLLLVLRLAIACCLNITMRRHRWARHQRQRRRWL